MRKLAHIEVISKIDDIPGADKIEKATVLGWQCVVKKGEFTVGEKIIYVEVDSVMPEKPEFEFLRDRKFRVRTIKLRGQISQGLVLPLNSLDNYLEFPKGIEKIKFALQPGDDVTEYLGITKYLSPTEQSELQQQEQKIKLEKNKLKKFFMRYSWFRRLFLSRKQKQGFPYWCPKTDEERVQNLHWNEFYENYKDREVYVTEKIDYQSVTFTGKIIPRFSGLLGKLIPSKKYKFVVCSRNMTTNNKNSLYWQIAKKYNIEQILRKNPTVTIQGEQGDTKVQGNKYGITEPTMWVFNIIDHESNYHYDYAELERFCEKYNLQCVPQVPKYNGTLSDLGSTTQEILEFAKGKSVINPKIEREGVVIRCVEKGKKVFSFKAVNNDFLLKYD
jgi:hypothetical protein